MRSGSNIIVGFSRIKTGEIGVADVIHGVNVLFEDIIEIAHIWQSVIRYAISAKRKCDGAIGIIGAAIYGHAA